MPAGLLQVDQVLSVLAETPERIQELTAAATEAQLHAAPTPGEWSVNEILAHLRSCSDMWGGAIEAIIASDHPTIRAVNPVTWIKRTDYLELDFAPSFKAYRGQREHLLAVLRGLGERDWSRSATVLGGGKPLERTVHSYADRLARHERSHWKQVAKTVTILVTR